VSANWSADKPDNFNNSTIPDPIIDFVLLSETTETEVEENIFGLKNCDALGVDERRLSLLRHCLTDVVSSIVRVVNKSFKTSVVLLGMKKF
jgi:hypothetical protein